MPQYEPEIQSIEGSILTNERIHSYESMSVALALLLHSMKSRPDIISVELYDSWSLDCTARLHWISLHCDGAPIPNLAHWDKELASANSETICYLIRLPNGVVFCDEFFAEWKRNCGSPFRQTIGCKWSCVSIFEPFTFQKDIFRRPNRSEIASFLRMRISNLDCAYHIDELFRHWFLQNLVPRFQRVQSWCNVACLQVEIGL